MGQRLGGRYKTKQTRTPSFILASVRLSATSHIRPNLISLDNVMESSGDEGGRMSSTPSSSSSDSITCAVPSPAGSTHQQPPSGFAFSIRNLLQLDATEEVNETLAVPPPVGGSAVTACPSSSDDHSTINTCASHTQR